MSDYTLSEAATALRDGSTSSRELTDAALDRAAKSEAELHAFLTLDHDGARSAAEAADGSFASGRDSGAFQGIPVALKDNLVTRGIATTAASQILAGWVPPYDGTAVVRLKGQGAVVVGKTNLDEFAMGSSTENSAFGPSRNPWDTDRVPGGSSGGSAIAVAVGSAVVGFGSDTGGSIRQPAALCGVVGMKPTYGLVSRYGLIAFASSLDQIGPITRTVEDSVTALEAVAGHDPLDATSYRGDRSGFRDGLEAGVRGLKIGVVRELTGEGFEPDVEAAVRHTVDLLSDAGAEVIEVSIPSVDVSLSAYYLIAPAECSANLARFDGVRYGLRRDGETVEDMMTATRADGFGPEVTRRILLGTYALSAGYYDAFYGQAQKVRTVVLREFEAAYRQVDVLVSATTPTTAFEIGSKTQDPLSMYLSDICTIPSNLTGHPAISVPVGLDRHGLPVGFQIMAPALGEAVLFRVARAVEQAVAFESRPPRLEEWT
ncbi:MAG: Asp-tRNA(Asn)/Glu-tRNA(Gln) amidotransferase subunit GatA [Acidimicrobiia bacterium]|nr:Asp-tRNA(Asn)/Glu-tRNA(Gln) amidotransferase subunit GatA [Acidimicrobiia bacterium]